MKKFPGANMSSIFEYISYGEFIKLIVCLSLDGVEVVISILLTPFVGDLFDIVGLVTSLYMFRWIGLFSLLELLPGFDILPINLITWLIWMVSRRRGDLMGAMRSFFP